MFLNKSLEKRLDDPFLGQASLSFLVFNWKLVGAYFKLSWPDFLKYFSEYQDNSFYHSYVWIPLLLGGFFCFGYPWLSGLIDDYRLKILLEAKKRKFKRLIQEHENSLFVEDYVTKLKEVHQGFDRINKNLDQLGVAYKKAENSIAVCSADANPLHQDNIRILTNHIKTITSKEYRESIDFSKITRHQALVEFRKYSHFLKGYLDKVKSEKERSLSSEIDSAR